MLELKNITKSYLIGENVQQVLKGISINFRRNEFTSILGASGSGKTTLLNIVGGLDQYDNGDLIIEGVSTKKYKDSNWDSYRNYRVGFIFQSYNLIMHQTVLANVELALTLSGVSKAIRRKKAIAALEKVGLEKHINKKPNQLSGGQMQRVAIARALVNDPEIILADEPTGALDSETSLQIMELLKEIAQEKLVIMVTHNPELAKKYSTRIIELKDGLITSDTNPFKEKIEANSTKKISKTSMSLLTSLNLSFNNLLTKKGRTLLTAFAGSIGIIGIALILSLSNGVSDYVSSMERDSLSDYPITFEKNSYDLSKLLTQQETEKKSCSKEKLCSEDDISNQINLLTNGLIKKNDLVSFKKFLDTNKEIKKHLADVQYGYNLDLQIYSNKFNNNTRINPNNFNILGSQNISEEEAGLSASLSTEQSPVFKEILENEEVLKSKYEIVAGKLPKEYNELVLIVGKDSVIKDSTLYALDIKDRKEVSNLLNNKKQKLKRTTYNYQDILNINYKLILNTDYYQKENDTFKDYSNDKNYLNQKINNGLDIKIVGILKVKDEGTAHDIIGYKHSLTEYVISNISKTEIYKAQTANKNVNVLTKEEFDGLSNTYENISKTLGIADLDNPDVISLYPKDFAAKEEIIKLVDQYNNQKKENAVTYTDLVKTVVSGVTSIINIISFVLIGFVAISLVVSSIMIAIITYISVLERTKEIGILRAIGASKKDVTHIFTAETIIEGLIAGIMGIGIAILLTFPINIIVNKLTQIENIASMPLNSAIFLILLSVILNCLAGRIPAKMASKKNPVLALRSE